MQAFPVQVKPVRAKPAQEKPFFGKKKSPKSGDFRAAFDWTATAPIGYERAQTGAFLTVTGAVCEDGVELACVQLLARE